MRLNLKDMDTKSQTTLISIGTVVFAVLITALFARHHQQQVQSIELATSAIQDLYLDEENTYLNPKISPELIKNAEVTAKEVGGVQGNRLQHLVKLAEDKQVAIANLSELYQSDEPIIIGEQIKEGLPLNEAVTPQLVAEQKEQLPFSDEDALTEAIYSHYDQILATFNEIETASNQINHLSEEVHSDSLEQEIQAFSKVEEVLLKNQKHPQTKAVIDKYMEKCRIYGADLVEHTELLESNQAISDAIFNSRGLSAPLTGSPIDERPLVALTFDDGPTENTLEILEVLDEHDVTATFFFLGRSVEANPDIARAVVEAGHQIGNHSYSHANFDLLNMGDVEHETEITQEIIADATGVTPNIYRSPYGNGRQKMLKLYPDMEPIYWNVDSEDWLSKDEQITNEHIANHLQHRSIILMHDTQLSTTEAIKTLIPQLKEQGYVFVSPTQIPEADSYRL